MKQVVAFDVYGTLVDPVSVGEALSHLIGDRGEAFGRLWHDKKVEYAFRRALMERYADFSVCTRQALQYCLEVFGVELEEAEQQRLLARFAELPAYGDVIPALEALRAVGHRLVAFSNGPEAAVRRVLDNAGVLSLLEDVISVDDLRTYKPSPRVYRYLLERTGMAAESCWLISGNSWDVLGAKGAGLKAAWIRRRPDQVPDPWELAPDLVLSGLDQLAEALG